MRKRWRERKKKEKSKKSIIINEENKNVQNRIGRINYRLYKENIELKAKSSEIIAKVYYYLQNEYEALKSYNSSDLSPLANILRRTAEATGVSQQTVTRVLRKRKREKEAETAPEKRFKGNKDDLVYEDDVSPIEEDSGSEQADEAQHSESDAPDSRGQPDEEPLIETLKIEIAEEHEEYSEAAKEIMRRDPLAPPIDELATAVQSISCAVKTEPPDEEPHTLAQTHTHTDTATSSGTADSLHSELWLCTEIKTEDNPHEPTSDDVTREPPGS